MAKFEVGDRVRITTTELDAGALYGMVGVVTEPEDHLGWYSVVLDDKSYHDKYQLDRFLIYEYEMEAEIMAKFEVGDRVRLNAKGKREWSHHNVEAIGTVFSSGVYVSVAGITDMFKIFPYKPDELEYAEPERLVYSAQDSEGLNRGASYFGTKKPKIYGRRSDMVQSIQCTPRLKQGGTITTYWLVPVKTETVEEFLSNG